MLSLRLVIVVFPPAILVILRRGRSHRANLIALLPSIIE